jgi:hypothetical protein
MFLGCPINCQINCQLLPNKLCTFKKSPEALYPQRKKLSILLGDGLRDYLIKYDREEKLPVQS